MFADDIRRQDEVAIPLPRDPGQPTAVSRIAMPCRRLEEVQVISETLHRRTRASRPAAGCAASAIGGSEDGRASLYGDGLVRVGVDGPAADGVPARRRSSPGPAHSPRIRSGRSPAQHSEPRRGATAARRQEDREKERQEGGQARGQEDGPEGRAAKKASKKTARRAAKKSAKKSAKKRVKKAARRSAKKRARKAAKKTVRKPARKAAKRRRR